jgi:protein involved in polysaccharide export with SLBB domain
MLKRRTPFFWMPIAAMLLVPWSSVGAWAEASWTPDVRGSDGLPLRPALDDPKPGTTDYTLGTGDKVRIIVYGEDDLGGTFQVDTKGYVQLPLIGQVAAAGATPPELSGRIAATLSDGYVNDPRVNVEVTQYRPFYVIGEVGKPGQYDYVNEMSVPNAIALAGGYTVKAVTSWVYLRHEHQTAEVRVAADDTTKVRPGDVLRIPDTMFWSVLDVINPLATTALSARPY